MMMCKEKRKSMVNHKKEEIIHTHKKPKRGKDFHFKIPAHKLQVVKRIENQNVVLTELFKV